MCIYIHLYRHLLACMWNGLCIIQTRTHTCVYKRCVFIYVVYIYVHLCKPHTQTLQAYWGVGKCMLHPDAREVRLQLGTQEWVLGSLLAAMCVAQVHYVALLVLGIWAMYLLNSALVLQSTLPKSLPNWARYPSSIAHCSDQFGSSRISRSIT